MGAALRETSLQSQLGTRSGPGSLLSRHRGRWDPCVLAGSSQWCLAQGHGHIQPRYRNTQGHRAQFTNRGSQPPPPSRAETEYSSEPQSYGHSSHCVVVRTALGRAAGNTALSGLELCVPGRLNSPGSGLGLGHAHTPRVRALLVEQRRYHKLKCPSERKCVCTPHAASMLHLTQCVCVRRTSLRKLGFVGFWGVLAIPQGIWNLSPRPGIEPAPRTLEAWSLNHWTGSPKKACFARAFP